METVLEPLSLFSTYYKSTSGKALLIYHLPVAKTACLLWRLGNADDCKQSNSRMTSTSRLMRASLVNCPADNAGKAWAECQEARGGPEWSVRLHYRITRTGFTLIIWFSIVLSGTTLAVAGFAEMQSQWRKIFRKIDSIKNFYILSLSMTQRGHCARYTMSLKTKSYIS